MDDDPLNLFMGARAKLVGVQKDLSRLRVAYRNVFDSPDGQIVFQDLANASGFLAGGFVPGDPYSSVYNEGMRSLFLRIFDLSGHTLKEDIYVGPAEPSSERDRSGSSDPAGIDTASRK